jgi:hypothetical protein
MKKLPWRKISPLAVTLIVASALVGAIIPSKQEIETGHDGSLTNSTNGFSCTTSDLTKLQPCPVEYSTLTSAPGKNDSTDDEGNDTQNNTSEV